MPIPFWSKPESDSNEHEQLKAQNDQLSEEIACLRQEVERLTQLVRVHNGAVSSDIVDAVSDDRIKAFVSVLLSNPDVNISFVPDSAEAALYEQGVRTGLHLLAHTLQTVRIDALGHTFGVWMKPNTVETKSVKAKKRRVKKKRAH